MTSIHELVGWANFFLSIGHQQGGFPNTEHRRDVFGFNLLEGADYVLSKHIFLIYHLRRKKKGIQKM
jgi:hypothetical protein